MTFSLVYLITFCVLLVSLLSVVGVGAVSVSIVRVSIGRIAIGSIGAIVARIVRAVSVAIGATVVARVTAGGRGEQKHGAEQDEGDHRENQATFCTATKIF